MHQRLAEAATMLSRGELQLSFLATLFRAAQRARPFEGSAAGAQHAA